jgi:anti-anti-sigma factor
MGAPADSRLVWPLSIDIDRQDGITVVKPRGRLGTLSSGTLIESMVTAIAAGDRRIAVDMSGVDYISSAGLLALDAVAGRLHQARGRLVLFGVGEPVRLAFDLAGLLPQFEIEDGPEAAVTRLTDGS